MSVVTVTIKSGNEIMSHEYELIYVDVSKEFNKIPTAELKFKDGSAATQQFKILDAPFFEIGKKIQIGLKYEGKPKDEAEVFSGIVINKLLELNKTGPTLTIELSDEVIRMNSTRKNTVHLNKKDSAIIKEQIKQNTLAIGTIEATNVTHHQMVQYYATDWDFMVSRAEANAQFVSVSNGTVSMFQPKVAKTALALEFGLHEIYDFDLQLNATAQYEEISAMSWDISKQDFSKKIKGKADQSHHKTPKDSQITALGTQEKSLLNTAHLEPLELKAWSDSELLKTKLSFIKGWIKIPGTSNIKVGETIEIKGFSDTFSGKNIISGVRHEVTLNSWKTHIQIGIEACKFASNSTIIDTPAAGLLPGVNGLQIGIIKALDKDENNLCRVKVFIPAFGVNQKTIWARLATLDAGKEHGTFFIPELGDEVIIGFLNDDPRHAIILGSMYNPTNKPSLDFTKNSKSKGIFTNSGYQLLFNEEQQQITIATSEKNKIVINEKTQAIEVSDANGNRIELNKNGIHLSSEKDCEISVKKNLNIVAGGNISLKGKSVELI